MDSIIHYWINLTNYCIYDNLRLVLNLNVQLDKENSLKYNCDPLKRDFILNYFSFTWDCYNGYVLNSGQSEQWNGKDKFMMDLKSLKEAEIHSSVWCLENGY